MARSALLITLLVGVLAVSASALPRKEIPMTSVAKFETFSTTHDVDFLASKDVSLSLPSLRNFEKKGVAGRGCTACENFATQMVGNLEKILLETVVGGTCTALCSLLPEGMQLCMLGCQILGFKEFIGLIQELNGYTDPVYFCKRLRLCHTTDNGSITDGSITVPGQPLKIGDQWELDIKLDIAQPLGAGELIFMLQPPNFQPLGSATFESGFDAGAVEIPVKLQLQQPDDPEQGPQLPGGEWVAKVIVCQLTCGSPYKDADLYHTYATTFTVSNSTSVMN